MTFTFLVHPRARLSEDMGRVWGPLGRVPESVYAALLRRAPLPPITMAGVHIGGEPVGHVVLVPFGARHLLEAPGAGRERVSAAVDRAVALGSRVVGLGALTATVTAGGATLRGRTDIGVTNGNAFTAAVVDEQARTLLEQAVAPSAERHVAVVGATGSVGTAVCQLLARDRAVDRLTLVARNETRLERLAQQLRHPAGGGVRTTVSRDLRALRQADLVILLTASADALLGPEHLGRDAVVLDATQPRNTSPELVEERPDVLVVDGGVVDIPSLRLTGGNIGLPDGRAYACFAETALLSLTGHRGHFAIGAPTMQQVEHIRALAVQARHLGFTATTPTSFGRPVHLSRRAALGAIA